MRAGPVRAKVLSVGVKGGVPVTDAFHRERSAPLSFFSAANWRNCAPGSRRNVGSKPSFGACVGYGPTSGTRSRGMEQMGLSVSSQPDTKRNVRRCLLHSGTGCPRDHPYPGAKRLVGSARSARAGSETSLRVACNGPRRGTFAYPSSRPATDTGTFSRLRVERLAPRHLETHVQR